MKAKIPTNVLNSERIKCFEAYGMRIRFNCLSKWVQVYHNKYMHLSVICDHK